MSALKTHALLVLFPAILGICGCSGRKAGLNSIPPKERMVIVVSLDGFPAYALEDQRLPIPTLRRLAGQAATAERMQTVNPSVTWPVHSTLATGVPPARHGVLFNGLLLRDGPRVPPRVEQWRDKAELVKAPTVYDLAYKAGLTTAQVDWIPTLNSGTMTWEFPEIPVPKGAVEREMAAEGIISEKDLGEFRKLNVTLRDHYWTEAAAHIIRRHKPNLLLYHLLNQDAVHHRFGPGSLAATTAYAYADSRVKRLLDAVDEAGMRGRTTLLILSDHGFREFKRTIRANAVLARQKLLRDEGGKVTCDAYVIPEGGTGMVYVTDPARREKLIPRLKAMFASLEGIGRVLEAGDFPALGLPTPRENNQMSDLLLVAKPGYGFAAGTDGEPVTDVPEGSSPASHGFLASDPQMDSTFMAWGYGIKAGARLGKIAAVDVAPTVAALLGLKLEGVAGRELREMFQQ